jgi:general secretion pathway protein A
MYESFYGLKEKPFRTVADPGYLYPSGKHKQALTFLEYGLMEDAGIVLLTGEAGSGKTTLIRFILLTLNDMGKDIMPAVVFNVNFSSGAEIVDIVMQSFGLSPKEGKTQSLEKFHVFLRDKLEEGKKVWLVIDEAQNLSREALEEVRMFSNLQSDEKALLHIMLVGQPELRARLRQPEFGSFSQRIAVNYHIEPLTAQEASEYISYRLNKAGGRTDIFEPEAVGLIFQASGGIPRTINLLCDAALVYGFGYELEKIGTSVVEQVIADKGGLGLASAAGEEAVAQGGETRSGHGKDNGLRERIEALEARIGRLQDLVETHMDESNNGAHRFSKDLIDRLTKLLLFERARSDRILSQYKTLYAKYRSLVGKEADKGRPEK